MYLIRRLFGLLFVACFIALIPVPDRAVAAETLIDAGDTWSYFKGNSAPPSDWKNVSFDDSGWSEGPSGFGYSSDIAYATTFADMYGNYVAFYLRKTFQMEDTNLTSLQLAIDYDDGFIAYINGVVYGPA